MQKTLDLSIKYHETHTLEGEYLAKNGKPYPSYMNNADWDTFKADMENHHSTAFIEYDAGAGGELKEKGGFPPKMASYGSSSRMIYNLSKHNPAFHYEAQLSTKIGGIAHMDGFLEKEEALIFVEAKCREPYGKKSSIIKRDYAPLYTTINDDATCNVNIKTTDVENGMDVHFSVNGTPITHFDIKQMICHLLGIAWKLLHEPTQKKISFVYLCYNPKYIEIISEKKASAIYSTYDAMCAECNAIDFAALFRCVLTYLAKEAQIHCDVDMLVRNFSFALCDQTNYKSFID